MTIKTEYLEDQQPLSRIVYDDNELDDDEEEQVTTTKKRMSLKPKERGSRRRRRSSARFLKLGDVAEDGDDDDEEEQKESLSNKNLGEMYQKTIRMNAENRINASNSWNLSLIDHLDRFLTIPQETSSNDPLDLDGVNGGATVNFTKASCTLDASVKIYSYRVDDIHLTSYKVLANLNRTETGKDKDPNSSESGATDSNDPKAAKKAVRPTHTETLEQNLANINIHKLDSAFDIDPLFHKMSKTFDEGGAKGLLLANLGVGTNGCNIVFDSTLDDEHQVIDHEQDSDAPGSPTSVSVDVTSLTTKLDSLLGGQSVNSLPLVPQLASLREEYAQLQHDGFVEQVTRSERYAPLQEDEKEADRSIHKEAIERSRASQADLGGRSHMEETDDDSAGDYAAPDFGGGDDNDDDMDDGGMIGSFLNDGDSRLSSSSFAPERGSFQSTFEASQPPSQATFLLDAIAAGEISGSQSNYEYFNSQAFENMQGNMWAGAAHWKKGQSQRKTKLTADATPAKKKTASRANKQTAKVFVNLSTVPENLDDLLRQAPKGRRGVDPLQLSKAMKSKHSNVDNLLPLDVGIGINQLTCLFSRPNSTVAETVAPKPTKNVGFGNVQTVAFTSGGYDDEDSYGGDDNDGPGFDFGGDDNQEFVVQDLEGIRKVQKVQVGYATIAKKVDVKRLKSDLWTNLESVLKHKQLMVPKDDDDESGTEEDDEEDVNQVQPGTKRPTGPPSFQDTVRDMQATQSQADATLPFYFICVLHLANEKGLALESKGLEDFVIHGQ